MTATCCYNVYRCHQLDPFRFGRCWPTRDDADAVAFVHRRELTRLYIIRVTLKPKVQSP